MATIHFRDDTEPEEYERIFVAENGWVAVSGDETPPVMYPPDRIEKLEGSEDIFYDTVVLTDEFGTKRRDEQGRVVQVPELVSRMVYELEID
ncbi:hypothetical protein ACFOZ7_03390 [Natribaculum luteum]|uniref:Uncharacterized protein n=1 Tax=Natribaculum luteum TaxID=1586232 RepID=A0ABD5NVQ7_9EURY|nr:hypothetical protein [Natribaculum luteum]